MQALIVDIINSFARILTLCCWCYAFYLFTQMKLNNYQQTNRLITCKMFCHAKIEPTAYAVVVQPRYPQDHHTAKAAVYLLTTDYIWPPSPNSPSPPPPSTVIISQAIYWILECFYTVIKAYKLTHF